jgi:hypothetical protein
LHLLNAILLILRAKKVGCLPCAPIRDIQVLCPMRATGRCPPPRAGWPWARGYEANYNYSYFHRHDHDHDAGGNQRTPPACATIAVAPKVIERDRQPDDGDVNQDHHGFHHRHREYLRPTSSGWNKNGTTVPLGTT